MTFVFAYLASLSGSRDWPVHLMYGTEAALVAVAFVCIVLAGMSKGRGTQLRRDAIAVVGGISVAFALIMPFELAPFFFGAQGEVMLATILLILVYPFAAALFIFGFRKGMKADSSDPHHLPAPER